MNSIILIGNKIHCDTYIETFIQSHAIKPYYIDRFLLQLKIADVRALKQKISIKIEESAVRLVVIESGMTFEAQNAFLKTLEELPSSVYFIFCTSSKDVFLPTIISRCQIEILVAQDSNPLEKAIEKKFMNWNSNPLSYNLLAALIQEFNNLQTKEDVTEFLLTYRQFLIHIFLTREIVDPRLVSYFVRLCEIYSLISQNNINRRSAIEVLNFSQK
jgi:hypothetical protein